MGRFIYLVFTGTHKSRRFPLDAKLDFDSTHKTSSASNGDCAWKCAHCLVRPNFDGA